MKVFVVRYNKCINMEHESGNFETCYASEEKAKAAMEEDRRNVYNEWSADGKAATSVNDAGDFCTVSMCDRSYDYHEWFVDCLDLEN